MVNRTSDRNLLFQIARLFLLIRETLFLLKKQKTLSEFQIQIGVQKTSHAIKITNFSALAKQLNPVGKDGSGLSI